MKTILKNILPFIVFLLVNQQAFSQNTRENAQLLTSTGSFDVVNNANEYWYSYTADSVCIVTFSTDYPFTDWGSPFDIYAYKDTSAIVWWYDEDVNCCSGSDYLKPTNKSEISVLLKEGETVYFVVRNENYVNVKKFTVKLNISKDEQGLTFQNPEDVYFDSIPMTITKSDNLYSYKYYGFKATEDMIVNLSKDNYLNYRAYRISEDGTLLQADFWGSLVVYAGETFLFEFLKIYSEDFNWYFSAKPVETGNDCYTPRKIDTTGIISFNNSNGSDWIHYVATKSGYYTFSLADTISPDVKLIHWNYCDYITYPYQNYNDTLIPRVFDVYLKNGASVLIELTGGDAGEVYYAEVTYEKERVGDICQNPVELIEDSTYVSLNPVTYFSFAPSESSDYLITLSSIQFGYIEIGIDCQDSFLFLDHIFSANSNYYTIYPLIKDSTYTISITREIGLFTPSTFNIHKYIPEKGDFCSDAILLPKVGTYTVDNPKHDSWMKYVAEYSGSLSVYLIDSFCFGCKKFDIFKNNCDTILLESESAQSNYSDSVFVDFSVTKGDTILIKFYKNEDMVNSPFTIGYSEKFVEGSTCDHPLFIDKLPTQDSIIQSTKLLSVFYTFTLDHETEVIISDGSSSNILQIYSDCQTRFALSESGEVTKMFTAGDYIVEWVNTSGEDINWSISINDNPDTDKDGKLNAEDEDDDNDGVLDINDALPYDATETADNDKDGLGDNTDTDDDNDGILDMYDPYPIGNVSVAEVGNHDGIKVIPNPALDKIQIMGIESGAVVSLKIVDSNGAGVYVNHTYIVGADIDVSLFKESNYYVVIKNLKNSYTTTFVKK